jgi:hypothetical protein
MSYLLRCKWTKNSNGNTFTGPCVQCKKPQSVTVEDAQLRKYEQGAFVQDAFPQLSKDQREFIISGICGPCFDSMFEEQ